MSVNTHRHTVHFAVPPLVPPAGSQKRRQRAVLSLLRACRESEPKFIARTLVQVGFAALVTLHTPAFLFVREGSCLACTSSAALGAPSMLLSPAEPACGRQLALRHPSAGQGGSAA